MPTVEPWMRSQSMNGEAKDNDVGSINLKVENESVKEKKLNSAPITLDVYLNHDNERRSPTASKQPSLLGPGNRDSLICFTHNSSENEDQMNDGLLHEKKESSFNEDLEQSDKCPSSIPMDSKVNACLPDCNLTSVYLINSGDADRMVTPSKARDLTITNTTQSCSKSNVSIVAEEISSVKKKIISPKETTPNKVGGKHMDGNKRPLPPSSIERHSFREPMYHSAPYPHYGPQNGNGGTSHQCFSPSHHQGPQPPGFFGSRPALPYRPPTYLPPSPGSIPARGSHNMMPCQVSGPRPTAMMYPAPYVPFAHPGGPPPHIPSCPPPPPNYSHLHGHHSMYGSHQPYHHMSPKFHASNQQQQFHHPVVSPSGHFYNPHHHPQQQLQNNCFGPQNQNTLVSKSASNDPNAWNRMPYHHEVNHVKPINDTIIKKKGSPESVQINSSTCEQTQIIRKRSHDTDEYESENMKRANRIDDIRRTNSSVTAAEVLQKLPQAIDKSLGHQVMSDDKNGSKGAELQIATVGSSKLHSTDLSSKSPSSQDHDNLDEAFILASLSSAKVSTDSNSVDIAPPQKRGRTSLGRIVTTQLRNADSATNQLLCAAKGLTRISKVCAVTSCRDKITSQDENDQFCAWHQALFKKDGIKTEIENVSQLSTENDNSAGFHRQVNNINNNAGSNIDSIGCKDIYQHERNCMNMQMRYLPNSPNVETSMQIRKDMYSRGHVSKFPCEPLKDPIPNRFQGDIEGTKDVPIADFFTLVNFPADNRDGSNMQLRSCVMCGKFCPTSSPRKNGSGSKSHSPSSVAFIPKQNKGLCTECDVTVWVVTSNKLQIKWCKGCKNFRPWAAFGDKGHGTKCVRCRERQREKYALQKEDIKKKRKEKKSQ